LIRSIFLAKSFPNIGPWAKVLKNGFFFSLSIFFVEFCCHTHTVKLSFLSKSFSLIEKILKGKVLLQFLSLEGKIKVSFFCKGWDCHSSSFFFSLYGYWPFDWDCFLRKLQQQKPLKTKQVHWREFTWSAKK